MIRKYELFSAAVSSLYHGIQKIERVEMGNFGLKGPHAQVLLVMSRYPEGITSTKLCEVCEKDKAAISRSVAELEQAGVLMRAERSGNRYRVPLVLTEKGKEAAQAVSRRARQAVEQAGEGLTDEQREIFYSVLAMISENLHGICKDGLK